MKLHDKISRKYFAMRYSFHANFKFERCPSTYALSWVHAYCVNLRASVLLALECIFVSDTGGLRGKGNDRRLTAYSGGSNTFLLVHTSPSRNYTVSTQLNLYATRLFHSFLQLILYTLS